jgi:hypothetical protein
MSDNKFPSKYSNGKFVSAAQFITEMICENKARKDKKDLHYRFWTNKEWASFYRSQIASAHKLLKKYEVMAIAKALKHDKARKIYSLRAPHLIPIIDQQQYILDQQVHKDVDYSESRAVQNNEFRKSTNKKSIISKLREIE